MAKSGMNIITRTYRGHVGKQIVIKWYDGKSVISKMPEFTKPWSAAQTEYRKRFKKAAKRASRLAMDPDVRSKYIRKLNPSLTVYNLILRDILKGKEICR
jgi:hypothetical protein